MAKSNINKLCLFDNHASGILGGDYELSVSQTIKWDGDDELYTLNQTDYRFEVGRKMLRLFQDQIASIYPAPNSSGSYTHHLPHMMLHSSTLPWESRPGDGEEGDPFLFLLLLDESESDQILDETITLDDSDDSYSVLTISSTLFSAFFQVDTGSGKPDKTKFLKTLRLLSHVRQIQDDGTELSIDNRQSCIMGNRLPAPGSTSIVHLVSLTDTPDGPFHLDDLDKESISLYSLFSYRFQTTEDAPDVIDTMIDIINGLDPAAISSIKSPEKTEQQAAKLSMHQAFVPLLHHFRNGDQRYSLYRGPLVPANTAVPVNDMAYVTASDQLLRVHPELGLLDVSYAAAWNLGRYLTLNSRAFTKALISWKRKRFQQMKQDKVHQHLYGTSIPDFTPVQQLLQDNITISSGLPETIQQSIKSWMNLEEIPLSYLLPDSNMLPDESLRFFKMDERWMKALINGAFEVGFAGVASDRSETDLWKHVWKQAKNYWPGDNALHGFFLSSSIVSDFPGITVTGKDSGGQLIAPLRLLRNGKLMMVLFAAETKEVIFSLPDYVMHAGLERAGNINEWEVALRNTGAGDDGRKKVPFHSKTRRIINIPELVASIPNQYTPDSTGSAKLGFHLLKKGSAIGIRFPD